MTSDKPAVEWFRPTSGTFVGWLGIAVAVAMLAFSLGIGSTLGPVPAGAVGAFLLALAAWVAMLRPRVGTTDTEVVVRGMVSTTFLPLAGIENIKVRQVLVLWVGGRRHICAAVGHSHLQITRARRRGHGDPSEMSNEPLYADHVAEAIEQRAMVARNDLGVQRFTEEQAALAAQVRRTWAWPEIAGVLVLGAALVVVLIG